MYAYSNLIFLCVSKYKQGFREKYSFGFYNVAGALFEFKTF